MRATPQTAATFANWHGGSPDLPQKIGPLVQTLFGDKSDPGPRNALADALGKPKDSPIATATRLVHQCSVAGTRGHCVPAVAMVAQRVQLTAVIQRLEHQLQAEQSARQALEGETEDLNFFRKPAPSGGPLRRPLHHLDRRQRAERLKATHTKISQLIRLQEGDIDVEDFMRMHYETQEGWEELQRHVEACTHWDGRKNATTKDRLFRQGYEQGRDDFRDSLKQDKFRSLYVADVCDLSDRGHGLMLRATGLQRILAGREGIKQARSIMNGQINQLLGLKPTPCGTGWQTDLSQTIKYILAQINRQRAAAGLPKQTFPRKLQFRITYDGAEVGGHPGLIAYLVPMNLGHDVESALAAYPILFAQCKENRENLQKVMGDVVESILETRDRGGVEFEGQTMHVDWWQSMDLASFWKQYNLTFNCNAGYCCWCLCTHHTDHDFNRWREEEALEGYLRDGAILPIPLSRTVFCATHAKMRVVEKLMKLLAAEAQANGKLAHWVEVVRALGLPAFNAHPSDKPGDPPECTALIGPCCNILLRNHEQVIHATGASNYEQTQHNAVAFGLPDPNSKTIPQLKKYLASKPKG